ncbi:MULTISPECIES: sensor histidine kinase [unclassified Campylobacter]|uniref:sensor histidine kinase n=1 Tax=unclassified Campylobacter TaxID=2593542 RepID=UPI0022E9C40B|nr:MULTISPECIES: HAMP domain-containing sensor histidine kinase [unclassified Campylobacter]MDA3080295.1 HAMP domain-containing histidine kinase [Campylobacter sp. CS_NA2]MDA3081839.1 HAMP domain-containing histidine kinase [Campylobacter sp. CS_NA1]MDA3086352.1 HAMP domain-containing histidine kinase [Campylobacter sp. CS_ED1]MDA3089624.1 HAMP domain-containing histidine kinase [Campylobacter sp. CS_ED2]WBR51809.1 HAMP domain-containing sensor histidine kinase [Campylobacter sp. CS_NA3]
MQIRKNHALPIFLLYILTSLVFLVACSWFYYSSAKQNIQRESAKEILSALREVDIGLKTGGIENINYDEIDDDLRIDITPSSKESPKLGRLSKDEFKKIKKSERTDKFRVEDGKMTFKTFIPLRHGSGYEVYIEDSEYGEEIREVIAQIAIFAVVCVVAFLLISYFIIRLSFRPLYHQINSLKSFITDATHEINTPLSVILMSVEMFEANPKKYLANIKTASKTLSNLYDDLVNLNLKNEPNELKSVDIKALIEERISYFNIMLNDKKLQIKANLEELNLQTDENKFKKIFDNILSNAIKYCDENSEICVNLTKKYFEIQNTGETISKENQAKIYEKFARFNKEKGGFGIGLSLVKKYCDELKFKAICQSENKITKFKIEF